MRHQTVSAECVLLKSDPALVIPAADTCWWHKQRCHDSQYITTGILLYAYEYQVIRTDSIHIQNPQTLTGVYGYDSHHRR